MAERQLILVADDDADILELVSLRLERWGYEVARASDGGEALEIARTRRPALCVFDVVMPNLTGFEVIDALRRDEATAEIPVILLTATVQEREMQAGRLHDADDYLTKPFAPEALRERVEALLAR